VDIFTTASTQGNPIWTDPSGYIEVSGSSYSTPLVAGRAVYLLQRDPSLDADTLATRVLEQAEVLPGFEDTVTHGRLNPTPVPEPTGPAAWLAVLLLLRWRGRRRFDAF
jgi:subtilisin family serine protease